MDKEAPEPRVAGLCLRGFYFSFLQNHFRTWSREKLCKTDSRASSEENSIRSKSVFFGHVILFLSFIIFKTWLVRWFLLYYFLAKVFLPRHSRTKTYGKRKANPASFLVSLSDSFFLSFSLTSGNVFSVWAFSVKNQTVLIQKSTSFKFPTYVLVFPDFCSVFSANVMQATVFYFLPLSYNIHRFTFLFIFS